MKLTLEVYERVFTNYGEGERKTDDMRKRMRNEMLNPRAKGIVEDTCLKGLIDGV